MFKLKFISFTNCTFMDSFNANNLFRKYQINVFALTLLFPISYIFFYLRQEGGTEQEIVVIILFNIKLNIFFFVF